MFQTQVFSQTWFKQFCSVRFARSIHGQTPLAHVSQGGGDRQWFWLEGGGCSGRGSCLDEIHAALKTFVVQWGLHVFVHAHNRAVVVPASFWQHVLGLRIDHAHHAHTPGHSSCRSTSSKVQMKHFCGEPWWCRGKTAQEGESFCQRFKGSKSGGRGNEPNNWICWNE